MINSRKDRIYTQLPDPVRGYELEPNKGYFSVIIPESTTNLVINPSMETNTTGYAAYNGAMAREAGWQAYGAYGLKLTPAVSTESGFYFGTIALTNGSTYTASVTIQGEEGKKYYIWFASTAGALIGTKRLWIGTGHKQRIWVTTIEPAGASRRVYVTRDGQYSDQNLFYADGLQVEAKTYPTTYCDGDRVGFVINEVPVPYYWTGTAHASTSIRSAQTRTGGREMSLLEMGIRILAVIGLGMAPLVDQALAMPGRGELAQGTGTMAREFTLIGQVYSPTENPRWLQAQRTNFIDAFKPDLTAEDQSLILRYQGCDEDGQPFSDTLDIICKYRGGLEGNFDSHQNERLALNFKMHLPLIQSAYETGVELGFQTTVANANYIITRDINGVWSALTTGTNQAVYAIMNSPNGSIYIGGLFTLAGGIANTVYIAQWNGTAFSPLGTGMNAYVAALAIGPDGNLYAGGNFTLAGGVAGTAYIAKWDGANWTPLGTGADGLVNAITFAPDGKMYIGGQFTHVNGVACNRIAVWDGATWAALGAGVDDQVLVIEASTKDRIYVGGAFHNSGGISTLHISMWDGITWSPLGSGVNDWPTGMITGDNGILTVSGAFTSAGGMAGTAYIARWNGVTWSGFSTPLDNSVNSASFDAKNNLYTVGSFQEAGGFILPDRMAIWNGSRWIPMDVNLPGSNIITEIRFDRIGNLYIGYQDNGSAYSATVTVPTVGGATSYPRIVYTGPGTLYQLKNYSTGHSIFFDLTLAAGEVADLNLNPTTISFTSNFRGNLLNTILPGSDMDFPLLPGNNNISTYMFGNTTASTKIVMTWKEQYWGLDGAAWK